MGENGYGQSAKRDDKIRHNKYLAQVSKLTEDVSWAGRKGKLSRGRHIKPHSRRSSMAMAAEQFGRRKKQLSVDR